MTNQLKSKELALRTYITNHHGDVTREEVTPVKPVKNKTLLMKTLAAIGAALFCIATNYLLNY